MKHGIESSKTGNPSSGAPPAPESGTVAARSRDPVTYGIPTTYNGVRFRSRLEAKWAATFDKLEWVWAYEPHDLFLYVPDFVLQFHRPLLVEVKPDTALESLKDYAGKIAGSGWEHEYMVVGSALFRCGASNDTILGILAEHDGPANDGGMVLGPARAFRCLDCGKLSLHHADQGWHCRVNGCGMGAGNEHVGETEGLVDEAWATAGNRVQWRGK